MTYAANRWTGMFCLVQLLLMLLPARQVWSTALAQETAAYRVGVAAVDVTPEYPVRLNGFGFRRAESEGISQRIWAKALALQHGEDPPVVLVTLDNLGIRETMVDEVAERLARDPGLARERLIVTFTHSHTTPKVNGACDNIFSTKIPAEHQAHIDRYTSELTDHVEQVCRAALKDRQPARLTWSVGSVGFAKNRRTPGGPVDHDVPVLIVRDLEQNIRAVYLTYACHCVTLSHNRISGDWAGYAQELLERRFPGAIAMVSIGCGSDANPDSGVAGDRVDLALAQGGQLTDEVARLAHEAVRTISGPLVTRLRHIDLPLQELPDREALQALAESGGPAGYNAETQIARLDAGQPLLAQLDYPVQTLSFGDDLLMVFLAGEVCVDYSHRLKQLLSAPRVWVHGYSNDFCAYIPSERLLREGGYGGGAEIPYFGLPAALRPGLEQRIVDEVLRQAPAAFHTGDRTQGFPPKSPEESLSCIATDPALEVELVAAEPLVQDPVALDFGLDGRLWIAEMPDYAQAVDAEFSPGGRIRCLEDSDGDGKLDRSHVFLKGLRFPTDVKVWRNGLLVCDAPHILYAEDTDQDGQADVVRPLYSGFATHNPHARVNSLQWGLDNWLYGSGGLFGGRIESHTGIAADVTGRDFRLLPDEGRIEPVTGRTQQGRSRDDWDNWFGCDNGTLLRHYPVVDRYMRRNPFVAPPPPEVYVPDYPNSQQLFPRGDVVLFKLSGAAGRPTSACGATIYRDELLGEPYAGNAFVCEPVNQLVHRLVLQRRGGTFSGRRAVEEQSSEFLASTDRWFRPVQVRTGPDGALWVVDMYRYVIEHPRWIPEETRAQLNVFAGEAMGRIYRVVPRGSKTDLPNLANLGPAELAQRLDTTNGTLRDLVHQHLIWNPSDDAAPVLTRLVRQARYPAAQVQAASVLEGLGQLTTADVQALLSSSHEEVRRQAVRLAENLLSDNVELQQAISRLKSDPSLAVRIQLACALGESPAVGAPSDLAHLVAGTDDPYLVAAALSSLKGATVGSFLAALLPELDHLPDSVLEPVLSTVGQQADPTAYAHLARQIVSIDLEQTAAVRLARQFEALASLWDAADARRLDLTSTFDETLRGELRQLLRLARQLAEESRTDPGVRSAAIRLAGRRHGAAIAALDLGDPPAHVWFADWLLPREPPEVQSAAVAALAEDGALSAASVLLDAVPTSTPDLRSRLLAALLSRPSWTALMLDSLNDGRLPSSLLDATARQRLLEHPDAELRQLAAARLGSNAPATGGPARQARQAVLDGWRSVLQTAGHYERGKAVFARHCAACHHLDNVGSQVGPDLAALTGATPESLYVAILDPNRDVDARYAGFVVVDTRGRSFSGLLVDETATSVTVREPNGKQHLVLRNQVDTLRSTGTSLMPEGLERDLNRQELADLLVYLLKRSSQ